jgi:hypothetical protein
MVVGMTAVPAPVQSGEWKLPGFWLWPRVGHELALSLLYWFLAVLLFVAYASLAVGLGLLVFYPLAIALLPRSISPVCAICRQRTALDAVRCEGCGNDDLRGRSCLASRRSLDTGNT